MIIVTGAAGFVGCNIIKGLNACGRKDILAVDDLTDGRKYRNLSAVQFSDYIDYQDFIDLIDADSAFQSRVEVIFHQGACSATTEWNGRFMMKNNYDYSKRLLHYCLKHNIQFIYASSAAVYGGDQQFDDAALTQLPLNVYGYSKWLFDQYVLSQLPVSHSQVVGLRYFNVYGPHEQHKDSMASVAWHLMNQLRADGVMRLFAGCDGVADGEQRRDFVYVDDVVKVNLWFWRHPEKVGIFNCGTGQARTFNAIAHQLQRLHGSGELRYIPFPEHLRGCYQHYTQANMTRLRAAGFNDAFHSLEQGLMAYYHWHAGLVKEVAVPI